MHRAGGLWKADVVLADRGALLERGFRCEAITLKGVHMQLVLRFHTHVNPRLRRMKRHMPRAVAQAALAAHRQIRQWRELAFLEVVDFQRAGVFGFLGFGPVAARDKNDRTIRRRGHDLMRENADIHLRRLLHLRAHRAVRVNAMHGDIAGAVVGVERIRAGGIHAGVDRALRQCRRLAVHLQRSARIHAQRAQTMHLARIGRVAGSGVGAGDIQKLPRRMRPHVLYVGGQRHRRARRQRQRIGIDIEVA